MQKISFSQFVELIIPLAEKMVTSVELSEQKKGKSISCKKGCGACCREVVPLSIPEAFYLAEKFNVEPIREKFSKNLLVLEKAEMNRSPLLQEASAYFDLQLACPFLVEEGCSIHKNRPMACREHLVSSNPNECRAMPNSSIQPLFFPKSFREALGNLAATLLGQAPKMIPMIRVFEWTKTNEDLGERVWPKKELMKIFLNFLNPRPIPIPTI